VELKVNKWMHKKSISLVFNILAAIRTSSSNDPMNNKYANIAKKLGASKHFAQESVNDDQLWPNPGFCDWLNIRRMFFNHSQHR